MKTRTNPTQRNCKATILIFALFILSIILVEYYDENYTTEEIMAHSSLSEARKYANKLLSEGFDVN